MKNTTGILLIMFTVLFWMGCEKDDSNSGGKATVTVSGLIMDKNGTALNGVNIRLGTSNSSTDASGAFSITASIASGERAVLIANLSGYMKGSYSFVAQANMNYTTKMILGQVDISSTLNVSTGGTVSLPLQKQHLHG